jgi:hypothetical protein
MCFYSNVKGVLDYIEEKKENQFVINEWLKFIREEGFTQYYEVRRALFGLGALVDFRDLTTYQGKNVAEIGYALCYMGEINNSSREEYLAHTA